MISKTAKNMSSNFHVRKSMNIGENGQHKYYQSCKAANLDIKKSTQKQDLNHIDFFLNGESVDVKGLKDTHREGKILIELKNVRGEDGWCNKNGPEWIAFDFGAFFLHVKNSSLLNLVNKKCDLTKKVVKITDALYKSYTRKDRKDVITIVNLSDVIKECEHWYLPNKSWNFPMELI